MNKRGTFESEHLTYRGICEEDAVLLVKWRSDFNIIKFFKKPEPLTLERHMAWYKDYNQDFNRVDYIVTIKETSESIGVVGVKHVADNTWEVSYMIGETVHQRKGYALEMVKKMCWFTFHEMKAQCIKAIIHKGNANSIRLVEKLGFTAGNVNQEPFIEYFLSKDIFLPKVSRVTL